MAAIIISEVNLIQDYVALKNNGNSAVNLKGWCIIDTTLTNQRRHEFTFLKDTWLAAGATLKVWSGVGKDNANNIYQNRGAPIWNNPGDTATIYDSQGNLIDSKTVGKPPTGGRGPIPPKPPRPVAGEVMGYVREALSGLPIESATVSDETGLNKTLTEKDGSYSLQLTATPDGIARRITAIAEGYASDSKDVIVYSNKTSKLDFDLKLGGGGSVAVDLSVKDYKLRTTKENKRGPNAGKIEIIELDKDKTWRVSWNDDYDVIIVYQNNKLPITAFGSTLFEKEEKKEWMEADKFGTPEGAGTFLNNEITVDYDKILLKNWTWYVPNWWAGYESETTEKKFTYKVNFYGKRGNFPPNAKDNPKTTELPKTVYVGVAKYKLEAKESYNYWRKVEIGIYVAGAAALFLGIGGLIAIAAATIARGLAIASVVGSSVGLGSLSVSAKKDEAKLLMDDPIRFVKHYKKLEYVKLVKIREPRKIPKEYKPLVKMMSAIHDSFVNIKVITNTNSKIYSAEKVSDFGFVKKHIKNKQKLKSQLRRNIYEAEKQFTSAKGVLRKVRIDFKLAKKGLQNKKVIKRLNKKFKINPIELKILKRVVSSKEFKPEDFNLVRLFFNAIISLKRIAKSL